MLKRFIVWLVTKFLSKRDTMSLIVDRWFVDDPRAVINYLYHLAYSSETERTIVPFDRIAAKKMTEGVFFGNIYVAVLLKIKEQLIRCGAKECEESDFKEFFIEVARIKEQKSVLKVRKELADHVRRATALDNLEDIDLVTTVLQNALINPATIAKFLTKTGE